MSIILSLRSNRLYYQSNARTLFYFLYFSHTEWKILFKNTRKNVNKCEQIQNNMKNLKKFLNYSFFIIFDYFVT